MTRSAAAIVNGALPFAADVVWLEADELGIFGTGGSPLGAEEVELLRDFDPAIDPASTRSTLAVIGAELACRLVCVGRVGLTMAGAGVAGMPPASPSVAPED